MAANRISDRAYRRHVRLFAFLGAVVRPIITRKFNYIYDDLSNIEGPFLLLSNHNTDYDPIFVGLAAKKQLYFVASEHVTRKPFLWKLLNFVFAPIIHHKGKAGINTISEMLRELKAGHNVAIFPEGNRSFNGRTVPFLSTIGKLARKSGAKLVTFRMEGGYLTQPRWGFTLRRGKIKGRLIHIFDADRLKEMTDDEINEAIKTDLNEDAFETEAREKVAFKGKKLAYGLETTLFICPKCRKNSRMHSSDTAITCDCGFTASFNEYGELIKPDGTKTTIAEWDDFQKESLQKEIIRANASSSDRVIFEDKVTLLHITGDHRAVPAATAALKAYGDHFEFNNHTYKPADILGVAIRSRNTIVTYEAATGEQYEIKGTDKMFCALKYLYLYEMMKAHD